jgi:hypothetical protein
VEEHREKLKDEVEVKPRSRMKLPSGRGRRVGVVAVVGSSACDASLQPSTSRKQVGGSKVRESAKEGRSV